MTAQATETLVDLYEYDARVLIAKRARLLPITWTTRKDAVALLPKIDEALDMYNEAKRAQD